jgi:hypothetical protein
MDQSDKPWYGNEVNVYSPEWENPYHITGELIEAIKWKRKHSEIS